MGDGHRRPDDVHADLGPDAPKRVRIHGAGRQPGEAIEEPLHPRRREDHDDPRRLRPDVLKAVRRPARHEDEGPRRRTRDLVAQPEAQLACEHVPRLVLVGVRMERRTVAGSDDVLEQGQRRGGLLRARLEGQRPAGGALDRQALPGLHDERDGPVAIGRPTSPSSWRMTADPRPPAEARAGPRRRAPGPTRLPARPPALARSAVPLIRAHPLADGVVRHAVLASDSQVARSGDLGQQLVRGGRSTRCSAGALWRTPQGREQKRCLAYLGVKLSPQYRHSRSTTSRLFLRPQCVSSVALQFGHRKRRFSRRLSFHTPLTWSSTSPMRTPRHISPCPHISHRGSLRPASTRRRFSRLRS